MEPERNNKRPGNANVVDGGRRKTRPRVTEVAVKDPPQPSVAAAAVEEEVEEFFAILRRMREAARLIGGGGRIGCPPMCFRSEEFDVAKKGEAVEVVETAAVVAVKEEEEGVVTSSRLDLNVEPEPGPV